MSKETNSSTVDVKCKCGAGEDDPIHSFSTEFQKMHQFVPSVGKETAAMNQTPEINNSVVHAAAGNLAFLLSVIRCGESLSPDEEANVRKVIERLGAEDSAAFHRGVDAAKDAIRSEVDTSPNDDAHFYAAVFINAIARKCGFDRAASSTPVAVEPETCPECSHDDHSAGKHKGTTDASYRTLTYGCNEQNPDRNSHCGCKNEFHFRKPVEPERNSVTCDWHMDDATDGEIWETDCGHAFVFNEGGPKDNKMAFCCYCGKQLTETRIKGVYDDEI